MQVVAKKSCPTVAQMKQRTRMALLPLNRVVSYCVRQKRAASIHERFTCNTLCLGVLNFNGATGRSGEWEKVSATHVQEQLGEGIQYIQCDEHKTADTKGSAGKWVAPGSWVAIRTLLDLPSGGSCGWF